MKICNQKQKRKNKSFSMKCNGLVTERNVDVVNVS